MIRWGLVCIAASALAMAGCGHKPATAVAAKAPPPKPAGPPADPDEALYKEIRAGVYQINSAMDAIAEARKTTKDMAGRETGKTSEALLTISKMLDDAGGTLSDFCDDPPPLPEFRAHFAAQDDNRLKAISGANDALEALHDAQDLLGTLIDSQPPEPEKSELGNAADALDGCISAVEDAIKSMGGKVEATSASAAS